MAYLMIVDDDFDFASATALALRAAGHEVDIQPEITQAISQLEQRPPDLLILDVMFPDDRSAGFSLARTIRAGSEKLRKLPILMVTAINSHFNLGFGPYDIDDQWLPVTGFLEKPVDMEVLRFKIEQLLQAQA